MGEREHRYKSFPPKKSNLYGRARLRTRLEEPGSKRGKLKNANTY